jgi:hypothetical protein
VSIASPPASTTLPEVIVIGAMKAGTSAVHAYLDAHPDLAMSEPKELNSFNGPNMPPRRATEPTRGSGNWHRGVDSYAAQFSSVAPVRGEVSPAYTSPTFPEVATRMASIVPDARLVYLVRDPFDRALSQYAHHRGEGSEARPVEEALLDPASQYVARSRFAERLTPFLGNRPSTHPSQDSCTVHTSRRHGYVARMDTRHALQEVLPLGGPGMTGGHFSTSTGLSR